MTFEAPPFVYVLTTEGADWFAEMAVISIRTLKKALPGARVVVLCDAATDGVKTAAVAMLKSLASDWRVCDIDEPTPVVRSRRLKLGALEIMNESFVFLDVDTLIARDVSGLWRHRGDLAAVRDGDRVVRPELAAVAAKHGWEVPRDYLNSGVFSVRNTPQMQRVFETALALWRDAGADDVFSDQFPLNIAVRRVGAQVTWLSPSYNVQTLMRPGVAMRPHVYHVFSYDFENRDDTVLHALAKGLKRDGAIDEDILEAFFATRNPWSNPQQPGELWSIGRPVSALAAKIRKVAGRRAA